MPDLPSTAGSGPLSYAIFQLMRAHRARAGELLRAIGLYPGQELLLMHLLDRDGQSQADLLEAVGLDASTISKAVSRMQKAGLVLREPAPHDRRVMLVHLTDQGRAMREPIAALWQDLEENSLRDLTPEQAEAFLEAALTITRTITGTTSRHDDLTPS